MIKDCTCADISSSKYEGVKIFLLNLWSRSSYQRCSAGKGVLRNFEKFTRKHLCQSLCFNKVAGLTSATFFKRESDKGVFLWTLRYFYNHLFLWNTSGGCFFCQYGGRHIFEWKGRSLCLIYSKSKSKSSKTKSK